MDFNRARELAANTLDKHPGCTVSVNELCAIGTLVPTGQMTLTVICNDSATHGVQAPSVLAVTHAGTVLRNPWSFMVEERDARNIAEPGVASLKVIVVDENDLLFPSLRAA